MRNNYKEQLDLNLKVIKESNSDKDIKEILNTLEENNNKNVSHKTLKKISHIIYKNYSKENNKK